MGLPLYSLIGNGSIITWCPTFVYAEYVVTSGSITCRFLGETPTRRFHPIKFQYVRSFTTKSAPQISQEPFDGSKLHKRVHFGSCSGCGLSTTVQTMPKKFTALEAVIQGLYFSSSVTCWTLLLLDPENGA